MAEESEGKSAEDELLAVLQAHKEKALQPQQEPAQVDNQTFARRASDRIKRLWS